MHKENKNNDFIQQFLLFHDSLRCTFMRVPRHMRVALLTQEIYENDAMSVPLYLQS